MNQFIFNNVSNLLNKSNLSDDKIDRLKIALNKINKQNQINRSNKIKIYQESILNKHFDQIYVINLPKKINRKITIISQFKKLGINYKFIDGINGLDQPYKKEWEKYNIHPGVWGYYMVMIKIFDDAIKSGHKSIVVFDDDVVFHNNFQDQLQNINSSLNILLRKEWLIIQLGASEYNWKYYNDDLIKKNGFYTPKRTDGSFATCYNYSSYQLLLNECIKFIDTYDSYALRLIYNRYPNYCFVIYPNLVIADVSDSSLREQKSMIIESKKNKWNLDEYNYYNRGDRVTIFIYFKDQLQKLITILPLILQQDYKNIEIKILNDLSKHKILQSIKHVIKDMLNVKIIFNQYPMGYLPTLKKAIDACESKYIFILDIDIDKDKIDTNLVSTLLAPYIIDKYDQSILVDQIDNKSSIFSPKKHINLSSR